MLLTSRHFNGDWGYILQRGFAIRFHKPQQRNISRRLVADSGEIDIESQSLTNLKYVNYMSRM